MAKLAHERSRLGELLAVLTVSTLVALVALASCKARNPEAAGLFSEGERDEAAEPAPSPDWLITCQPQPLDQATPRVYELSVIDDSDAADDSLYVTLIKTSAGKRQTLAENVVGHGTVATQGDSTLIFGSNVLTAEAANGTLTGLLTVSGDADAQALKVSCSVVSAAPRASST